MTEAVNDRIHRIKIIPGDAIPNISSGFNLTSQSSKSLPDSRRDKRAAW